LPHEERSEQSGGVIAKQSIGTSMIRGFVKTSASAKRGSP